MFKCVLGRVRWIGGLLVADKLILRYLRDSFWTWEIRLQNVVYRKMDEKVNCFCMQKKCMIRIRGWLEPYNTAILVAYTLFCLFSCGICFIMVNFY